MANSLSAELLAKIKPVTLSGERTMPVPECLKPLFPWGGVQRGTSFAVTGSGGWSLAMAVMASALEDEGWMAIVGLPDLHLISAADLGVRLDRLIIVEDPGAGKWATVVASLLESVDVVAVAPSAPVGLRDGRRLAARAREQESVLLQLDGGKGWPSSPDLTLSVRSEGWDGLGQGHGRLTSRRVHVRSQGRRAGRAAQTELALWLPGPDGQLAAITQTSAPQLLSA